MCLSHRLHLCIFPVINIDVMKSEERQKLAKERREEKAKYFGKYSRTKGFRDMLRWRRAPPSGRVEAGAVVFRLCEKWSDSRPPMGSCRKDKKKQFIGFFFFFL